MGLTIGVDIGGTKIAAGVVDEGGAILDVHRVPTPSTAEGIVDAIGSAVSAAVRAWTSRPSASAPPDTSTTSARPCSSRPTSTGGTSR